MSAVLGLPIEQIPTLVNAPARILKDRARAPIDTSLAAIPVEGEIHRTLVVTLRALQHGGAATGGSSLD